MIAMFPQQQACFENRPPTIEIPEHFIVRETLRECLEEIAPICEALVRLLRGIEDGSVRTRAGRFDRALGVRPSPAAGVGLLVPRRRRTRQSPQPHGHDESRHGRGRFRNEDLSRDAGARGGRTRRGEVGGTAPSAARAIATSFTN